MMIPLHVTLVEDLVPIILDCTHWTTNELVTLSLVSPIWLHPVRRRLYTHPTITSENQCRYLVRTLQSEETLKSFMKGINLWLEELPVFARDLVAIRFVLSLDALKSVSFLSPTATFLIQKIAHHRIVQRISIFPLKHPLKTVEPPGRRSMVEWHPRQAAKFASLKRLAISGATLHVTPPLTNRPYEFLLSDLIVSRCTIIHGTLPQLLHPVSWSHLHNLFILMSPERTVASETYGLSEILSHCGQVLQCFHLEYQSTLESPDAILIPNLFRDAMESQTQLVSLRKLHLVDMIPRQGWSTALQKIAARCPNLEVLKITGRQWPSFVLQEEAWPADIRDAQLMFPHLIVLEGTSKTMRSDWDLEYSVPVLKRDPEARDGLLARCLPCGIDHECEDEW